MANNTISQVTVNGTTYDLLDANTLSAVSALTTRVTNLESSVDKSKYQATISRIFFENTANDVAFEFQLANGRSLLLGVAESGAYYAHKESASDSWHYYWSGH